MENISNARFISETKYPDVAGQCRDFIDLDVIIPMDPYPLPDTDRLIDGLTVYHMLRFMDAYSRYNHIRMDTLDVPKITFLSNHGNYYYNIMLFHLKNVGASYQQLMDVIFAH